MNLKILYSGSTIGKQREKIKINKRCVSLSYLLLKEVIKFKGDVHSYILLVGLHGCKVHLIKKH